MGHGCEPRGVCQPEAESEVAAADSGETVLMCRREGEGGKGGKGK